MAAPAPTPAPHCPINFLKGGGNAAFSAKCIEELAKMNYSPEDFGSYRQVRDRIRAAKDRVKEAREQGRAPDPRDQYLARCQSGHLGQNANRQRRRGDPCSNLVDGHDDGLYPCMVQRGPATDRNMVPLNTEHGWVTGRERSDPTARGLAPENPADNARFDPRTGEFRDRATGAPADGGTRAASASRYPEGQMRADDDRRTQDFLDTHKNNRPAPTSAAGAQGANQAGATTGTGGSAGAAGSADAGKAGAPKSPPTREITGETAAECINNFRKMGEEAMRQKCLEDKESNRAKAWGPDATTPEQGAAYRRGLQEERARAFDRRQEARAAATNARAAQEQRRAELESARASYQANPTDANRAALQSASGRYGASVRTGNAAEASQAAAERDYANAARAHSVARNAECRHQQAVTLEGGGGRTEGRSPPIPPPPAVPPNAVPANPGATL